MFNGDSDITQILTPLLDTGLYPPDVKLIIYADNAHSQTAKNGQEFLERSGVDRSPNPPYGPDLAPSDLFLFDYIKDRLKGNKVDDSHE
jgi:hypothetical protein